jgi:hypothetical protein
MIHWLYPAALAFSPAEHQALADRCLASERDACLALADGLARLAATEAADLAHGRPLWRASSWQALTEACEHGSLPACLATTHRQGACALDPSACRPVREREPIPEPCGAPGACPAPDDSWQIVDLHGVPVPVPGGDWLTFAQGRLGRLGEPGMQVRGANVAGGTGREVFFARAAEGGRQAWQPAVVVRVDARGEHIVGLELPDGVWACDWLAWTAPWALVRTGPPGCPESEGGTALVNLRSGRSRPLDADPETARLQGRRLAGAAPEGIVGQSVGGRRKVTPWPTAQSAESLQDLAVGEDGELAWSDGAQVWVARDGAFEALALPLPEARVAWSGGKLWVMSGRLLLEIGATGQVERVVAAPRAISFQRARLLPHPDGGSLYFGHPGVVGQLYRQDAGGAVPAWLGPDRAPVRYPPLAAPEGVPRRLVAGGEPVVDAFVLGQYTAADGAFLGRDEAHVSTVLVEVDGILRLARLAPGTDEFRLPPSSSVPVSGGPSVAHIRRALGDQDFAQLHDRVLVEGEVREPLIVEEEDAWWTWAAGAWTRWPLEPLQVVDSAGRPVLGVHVRFENEAGLTGSVTSDLGGHVQIPDGARATVSASDGRGTPLPAARDGGQLVLDQPSTSPREALAAPAATAGLYGRWRAPDARLGSLVVAMGPAELPTAMAARQLQTSGGRGYVLGLDTLVHVRSEAFDTSTRKTRMHFAERAVLTREPTPAAGPSGITPTFGWKAGDRLQLVDHTRAGRAGDVVMEIEVHDAPPDGWRPPFASSLPDGLLHLTLDGRPWAAVTPDGWAAPAAAQSDLAMWEALVHRWIGTRLQEGVPVVEHLVVPNGDVIESTATFDAWVSCPAGRCAQVRVEDVLVRAGPGQEGTARWEIVFDPATLRPYRITRREVAHANVGHPLPQLAPVRTREGSVDLDLVWSREP